MSDDLVKALETMDWDDIRSRPLAAGVLMEEAAAEITHLRAALAIARREGMEEAAKIATEFEIVAHLHGPWSDVADECAVQASREIAAAIRAAAKEGKP